MFVIGKKIPLGLNIIKWMFIIILIFQIRLFYISLFNGILDKHLPAFIIVLPFFFSSILYGFYIVRGINKKKKYGYYLLIIYSLIIITLSKVLTESFYEMLLIFAYGFLILFYTYKKRSYFGIKGIIK